MTLQKIEFEYDIPDGYRFVRLGRPNIGELYINNGGEVDVAVCGIVAYWIIVEKIPETESKKHRWHDLMIEFANDKTIKIEYFNTKDKSWENAPKNPAFYECVEYRKKQTKKTVRFRNYMYIDDDFVFTTQIDLDKDGIIWLGDWHEVEI